MVASYTGNTESLAHNTGRCPDGESILYPFSLQASTPSTELYQPGNLSPFKKKVLFIFRVRGSEKDRERNISVWLPLERPLLGTWLTTQACASTGNGISDPLVHRLALNPLSHTSQGY